MRAPHESGGRERRPASLHRTPVDAQKAPTLLLACGAATATLRARFRALRGRGATTRRTRRVALAALGLGTLGLSVAVAAASPGGDPDPTFDGDGELVVSFGGTDHAQAVLVQPDGKLVVAGYGGPDQDFAVARLNRDGSLDDSFGAEGRAYADFGGDDKAFAAALQPDGRIVVAGHRRTSQVKEVAVARFDRDGSLDESFAPGGADGDGRKVLTNHPEHSDVEAVLVQPDGRIVLAGTGSGGQDTDFALTRLYRHGEVDGTTFERADFGGDDLAHAAALQPDGKIVVAGDAAPEGGNFAVARYEPDGSLDKTFGGSGKRAFGSLDYDSAREVLVQPDGRIVVAGAGGAGYDFLVARLNPDATPDGTFGTGGTSTIQFDDSSIALSAALQPDGKIVVAGGVVAGGGADVAVARIQPGGMPDNSFGSGGRTTVPVGTASLAFAVALQADAGIVAAGLTLTNENFAVVRLLPDPPLAAGGDPGAGPGGGPAVTPGVPRCAGKRATIVGTARRDRLRGTRRADVIVARAGNDVIRGLGGNDRVCAGAGNDLVIGGSGRDTLRGEAGRDRLLGGPGRDRLIGGPGRDGVTK